VGGTLTADRADGTRDTGRGGLGTDLHLDLGDLGNLGNPGDLGELGELSGLGELGGGGRPTAPGGVRAALIRALRDAVRGGRLAPGTRLPPSRTLAADLGLARNTVAAAYAELVAEGWLTARQGSGTRVAERVAPPSAGPPASAAARPVPYNEVVGSPDLSGFPRGPWLAAARRALSAAPNDALGYGDPRGDPRLRAALAGYLGRARGVRTAPERIVICAGFAQGLRLLARVLADRAPGAGTVAVEEYGLSVHRDMFTGVGLGTVPLPVDGRGARTDALAGLPGGARAVLLTPAHQFPVGVPLHPDRRAAAVDWARRSGAVVLEDDYDGEFRFDRRPVGAVQGLDPEHVGYLGTASKSLAPALRLAWMALPAELCDAVAAARTSADRPPGALDQLTLAEFITSGGYDRHVRGMRQRYRRRRDRLVAALAARAPRVRATGIAAGLHAVLRLPPGGAETLLAHRPRGIPLDPLGAFRHPAAPLPAGDRADAVVVGYGAPAEHAFGGALDALCGVLAGL
jgi:GntR family transcriptional regulator/MocR family aminotransferase